MELLNENKTYTVDRIINAEFSASELDEIIKTDDEILKCAVLLNENTDERIIPLLCNDPNTLVSNWARTKLNKCLTLYINKTINELDKKRKKWYNLPFNLYNNIFCRKKLRKRHFCKSSYRQ